MKVIGIEFAASDMNYVVVTCDGTGEIHVTGANRLSLGDTRSAEALHAFQLAIKTILTDSSPNRIAIKAKPETGGMVAGAPALKMEALVLATVSCDVKFISGTQINRCDASVVSLKAYQIPAYKAAACGCNND